MMTSRQYTPVIACLLMTSLLISACASMQPVNDAATTRIDAAASAEWPSFGRDYSNQRFSPLTHIDKSNVHKLDLAWQHKTGINASFQSTPLVVDGVMYVSLPFNHVLALDAKTGKALWRYEHQRRPDWKLCCGPANRGVAVADGKVFMGTVDARLLALDARTGKVLWDIDAVQDAVTTEGQESLNDKDPNSTRKITGGTGVGIAMAPVVYKGKVIVGITGVGYGLHIDNPREDAPLGAVIGVTGRYGRPGFLAAFDVNTGARVWQFDTIPAQGWEGEFASKTADGVPLNRDVAAEKASLKDYPDSARFGGGSAWSTPAIDAKLGLLYFGTGNPSPQMNDVSRPGDNLYTVSLVALDVQTGKLRWHYQQVPHDLWGYDLASPPVLFDLKRDGKVIQAVGQAGKTGWFYVHDRRTGKLLIKSDAFVPQHNLFAKATFEGTRVFPGILGGANWSPVALDQAAQQAYVAAIHAPINYTLHEKPGLNGAAPIRYAASEPLDEARWGLLSAIDLTDGKIRWQVKTEQPLVGGVLATKAGLLFTGEGNGHFNAYDSANGKLLWQARSDAGVNAPPISYAIDGEQYIAVAAGGNSIFGYKQGDNILVYKLKP
ncbi:pyrrolo-quinoline quinone [Pseudomethylobacillus aquaticus]|uniref:Pyrrolo-quinoline quinone n=2 Tax=Pseudomethylobacillus aquaticus TaxID=2676064 RepID=A0A3N0V5P9_9PROT|nr:pyrrolo-quinoline quinone [Pseudomethylobacillus aquaticus]